MIFFKPISLKAFYTCSSLKKKCNLRDSLKINSTKQQKLYMYVDSIIPDTVHINVGISKKLRLARKQKYAK